MRSPRVRTLGTVALLAAAAGLVWLAQGPSSPALSHLALVTSLSRGTAVIDETRFETGSQVTSDYAYHDGHYYSNKAPGLALLVLPAYLALDAIGLRTSGDATAMLWALGLVGAVAPTLLVVGLVRRLADGVEPGFGAAAAATLLLGTLLTAFGTMLFPHALSALLVFCVFALLVVERRGAPRLGLVWLAGLAGGLAVTTEYHNALAVAVLGVLASARTGLMRRGLAYSAGVVVGTTPLLLYNWWASGSPTRLSYEGVVLEEETARADTLFSVQDAVGLPSFHALVSLLFSQWGLVTAAPVLALGVFGAVLLWRRGYRAEVLAAAAVCGAYLLFSAAYYEPFGQLPPGPRLLLPMLPLLAVPLAAAFRALPLPTVILAGASVLVSVGVTVTRPLIAWDGDVLFRLVHPSWWSPTVVDLLGAHGAYRIVPLVLLFGIAVVCAALTVRPAVPDRSTILGTALAAAGWVAIATQGERLLGGDVLGRHGGALVLLVVIGLLAATVATLLTPRQGMR